MTEACSGLRGDFETVDWYFASELALRDRRGEYNGYWFHAGNRIVLGANAVDDGQVVRHEMLHALLKRGDHPAEYFVFRCGAIAPCGSACDLHETHRGVPTGARELPSESLMVALSLSPLGAPAVSVDSGWTTLMITATNTRAEPVWVRIPSSLSHGYLRAAATGTFHWTDEPRWAFRAGESRSLAFDLQFLTPGAQDTLWAFFGEAYAPARTLTVGR